jgi:hypothetical protein
MQYNFEQIANEQNYSNTNDISYNNESIEMLYNELFENNHEIFNSTFMEEEEENEDSVVYMYTIRPNQTINAEEDWN